MNKVVSNLGTRPLVNYNFMLRVDGMYDLPCKSIHSFTKENEYEYIQEGGVNDYVQMRRKPISRPFTIDIERYAAVDYFDPLPNGKELALPVVLFVDQYPLASWSMFTATKRTYTFMHCCVMKKTYGDLNAEQSGLLIETTTLSYQELLVVDMPFDALEES